MKNNRRKKQTSAETTKLYDKVTQLQTGIIDRLNLLKKNNKNCACSHFLHMDSSEPIFQVSANYYQSFWKLYLSSQISKHKIQQLETQISSYHEQIQKIEGMFNKLELIRDQGHLFRKKIRRKACEIKKQFVCKYPNCDKSYGTKLALKYHKNLKHDKQDQNLDSDD